MRTRSSSNLLGESSPNPTSSNPKRRNRRRSKQPFILEESLVDTMTDQCTMAIVVPSILAEQFELKHSLINMTTSNQFFGLEKDNPYDHIRWFNKITSTIKTTNLRNEISNFQQRFDESFHEAWDRYKDLLRACPHHGFTELHQVDTFYNALNPADQDSLNSAAGGNLLARRTQDVLMTIENKSKDNSGYRPPGPLPSITIANSKGELKAITTRSGIVLDGTSVPMPPLFINPEEDERVEETLTDPKLGEFTIKVPHPLVQKPKPPSQRNYVVYQRDPLYPNILYPSRIHKQKQQEKDEKMLKALLSNMEKLLELANTPLNENCSAVILKKLPEKLGDPGKFLIPCGFSELKCKALADLSASINLMPLYVWKKLGLPELISTRMTLELANRAIRTPAVISDPRVPLILGRPFLRTTRALIDVHGEEMILRDSDERLTLNIRHDTLSYSKQPQKESINMTNIYDDSCEDFLKDLFATNHQSGSPTFSSHTNLTSLEVKDDIFDPEGDIILDSTKDLPPPHNINPLKNDDLPFDIEFDLKEIKYLLNHDPIKEMDSILEDSVDEDNLVDLNDNLVDTMPEILTDEHALDYSSPPLYDEYDDDLFEVESKTEYVYDDPFDSKEDEIKEYKLLIDELDPLRSSDFLPSPEYDLFLFEYFSKVDALPSTNNEDKVFNPNILIQENLFEVITRVAPDKNVKKLAISHVSLILEDFDPPLSLYELPFHKEVHGYETLLF
nr:hypothetical protein [Tanacetum cinerariifolium]